MARHYMVAYPWVYHKSLPSMDITAHEFLLAVSSTMFWVNMKFILTHQFQQKDNFYIFSKARCLIALCLTCVTHKFSRDFLVTASATENLPT